MKIYAVCTNASTDIETFAKAGARDLLISYAVMREPKTRSRWLRQLRAARVRDLLLDSGAFSAMTRGLHVDLRDYYRVIEMFEPTRYAALDVIGDPVATARNLRQMEKDGFHPMPVYTRGAPIDDLRDLIERGYDDIAVGNLVGRQSTAHKTSVSKCLRNVFHVIDQVDESIKIHGFGLTMVDRLLEFPFYSVDASGSSLAAGLGNAYELRGFKLSGRNVSRDHRGMTARPELTEKSGIKLSEARSRRIVHNVRQMQTLATRMTALWEARGFVWPDAPDWSGVDPAIGPRGAENAS